MIYKKFVVTEKLEKKQQKKKPGKKRTTDLDTKK